MSITMTEGVQELIQALSVVLFVVGTLWLPSTKYFADRAAQFFAPAEIFLLCPVLSLVIIVAFEQHRAEGPAANGQSELLEPILINRHSRDYLGLCEFPICWDGGFVTLLFPLGAVDVKISTMIRCFDSVGKAD